MTSSYDELVERAGELACDVGPGPARELVCEMATAISALTAERSTLLAEVKKFVEHWDAHKGEWTERVKITNVHVENCRRLLKGEG